MNDRSAAHHSSYAGASAAAASVILSESFAERGLYAVAFDEFEGPLDLLLHLVRRHELSILDISISFVAEKYMSYLRLAQTLDIEIAGEYLVMAATLAYLKSRELLPTPPELDTGGSSEEGGEDPRAELIRRLIEYERFKQAAQSLGDRPLVGRDVFMRGFSREVELRDPGLAPVSIFKLAEAFARILDQAKIRKSHDVEIEPVTVRQRMVQLTLLLAKEPKVRFEGLFLDRVWNTERELRQMLVVTLMSILELVKLGVLGVEQSEACGDLAIERTVNVDELERVVADFRDDDTIDAISNLRDAGSGKKRSTDNSELAPPTGSARSNATSLPVPKSDAITPPEDET